MRLHSMQLHRIQQWPVSPVAREALRARWEGLLTDTQGASIFQTHDWHEAWWESFGAGHELQLLLISDGEDKLLAIAPMMLLRQRRLGLEQRQLMLIGTSNHASDYADLIVARGHAGARRLLLDTIAADRNWTHPGPAQPAGWLADGGNAGRATGPADAAVAIRRRGTGTALGGSHRRSSGRQQEEPAPAFEWLCPRGRGHAAAAR
jgi:hypothetical protein